MMLTGGLGSALLLLVPQASGPLPPPTPSTAIVHSYFAPPVDRPMAYHVTTRRTGRDGALISFSLVYALQWQRAGRGYQLAATLRRIESDAAPEVTRMLTAVLQPLVGETLTYHVASDGRHIEMVDSDGLWERVAERTHALAAGAAQADARQLAQMLAALPPEERNRLASADVRALLAPANSEIPVADGADISLTQSGSVRTVAKLERDRLSVGEDARPLEIDNRWTVDMATGLVLQEQRQSWIVEPAGRARTLVEERMRILDPVEK